MLILLLWACGGPTPTGASPAAKPGIVGAGSVDIPDRYPADDTGSTDTGETGDTATDEPYTGRRWIDLEVSYNPCFLREDGQGLCLDDDIFGDAPDAVLAEVGRGVGLNTAGEWVLWGRFGELGQIVPSGGGFHDLNCVNGYCAALAADGSLVWAPGNEGVTTIPGAFVALAEGDYHIPLCALGDTGVVTCWDWDWVATDVLVGNYQFISIVSDTVCGYAPEGSIDCWQGGHDPTRLLTPPGEYTSVASYEGAGCGVLTDTSITCWGSTGSSTGEPVTRSGVPGSGLAKVSIGPAEGCYITVEGELKCWPGGWSPPE